MTRAAQAYRQLLQNIRSGALAPGQRLREVELAQQLGISRTPVREALARLQSEGLVSAEPGRGLVVTELDHAMVSELYAMREVLEGTAARLAARHASDVELALLQEIASRDAALLDDVDALAANNRLFHDTLYRCAHNRFLLRTLSSLQEAMVLLGPTTLALAGRGAEATDEHARLMQALQRRDAEAAETALRDHIRAAYRARLTQLQQA